VLPIPLGTANTVSNTDLIAGIRRNDPAMIEAFYVQFERGVRYVVKSEGALAQDVEDLAHNAILSTILQIQAGTEILNADCFPSYVLMIAKRNTWNKTLESKRFTAEDPYALFDVTPELEHRNSLHHAIPSPEDQALCKERSDIILKGLAFLRADQVEILTRFYLREQPWEQICEEMNLTATQFRLNKSRAKSKLEKACDIVIHRRQPPLLPRPAIAVS
jgi:RNA polymerase sigma factor (sigma-70 family)